MHQITFTLPAEISPPQPQPSPRTRDICLHFGIPAIPAPQIHPPRRCQLQFPSLTLITGPSGCGKSTLLRRITSTIKHININRKYPLKIQRLSQIPLPKSRSVADSFRLPLEKTLELLSRAGLAEPRLWLRTPAQLSEGEQFRFRLARLMASPADILIADEFAALLDRITAHALAHQFAKFIRASRRAAIIATSHEDLAEDLQPTAHVRLSSRQGAEGAARQSAKRNHEDTKFTKTHEEFGI